MKIHYLTLYTDKLNTHYSLANSFPDNITNGYGLRMWMNSQSDIVTLAFTSTIKELYPFVYKDSTKPLHLPLLFMSKVSLDELEFPLIQL